MTLLISDVYGRVQYKTSLQQEIQTLDLRLFPKGIYTVQLLQKENQRIATKKLVRQW